MTMIPLRLNLVTTFPAVYQDSVRAQAAAAAPSLQLLPAGGLVAAVAVRC